jgi:hypothetical protein
MLSAAIAKHPVGKHLLSEETLRYSQGDRMLFSQPLNHKEEVYALPILPER